MTSKTCSVIGMVEAAGFLQGHQALGYVLAPRTGAGAAGVQLRSPGADVGGRHAASWRPHLARFIPDAAAVAAHAEWVVRNFFSYALNPSPTLSLIDEAAVRRFVTTYLTPAIAGTPKEH